MRVIDVPNVQWAIPRAAELLIEHGVQRQSRGGPVIVAPWPVTTVYQRPWERVVFWETRDANPFFHLYEALWMLAGCDDIAPLLRYNAQYREYSDDGVRQHGAYGYRWRHHWGKDQLALVARRLRESRDDRRSVIQMWDSAVDLDRNGRDVPCNTTAYAQINTEGRLDLTVCCRSNDIVWGAYGANAVHFSLLLEYLALAIGVPMGRYYQVSNNWHAYEATFDKIRHTPRLMIDAMIYDARLDLVRPTFICEGTVDEVDHYVRLLVNAADTVIDERAIQLWPDWVKTFAVVLEAHRLWRTLPPPNRFKDSLEVLSLAKDMKLDWLVSARQWLVRRHRRWLEKQ